LTAFLALIPRWVLYALVVALAGVAVTLTVLLADAKLNLASSIVERAALQVIIADDATKAAERETQLAEARTRVAERETELSNQIIEAQNEARKREALLRSAAVAAVAESVSLRDDVASLRGQLDQLSRDAVIERGLAIAGVLNQCAARYQGLAERCDRHASDVQTLTEAWPKSPVPAESSLPR